MAPPQIQNDATVAQGVVDIADECKTLGTIRPVFHKTMTLPSRNGRASSITAVKQSAKSALCNCEPLRFVKENSRLIPFYECE